MNDLTRQLRELVEINRAIVGTLEHEEVLRLVVDKTAAFMGADVCLLLLTDEQNTLRHAASHGIAAEDAARVSVPFDERVNVSLREALGLRGEDQFRGAPVMWLGSIRGLLVVYRSEQGEPADEDDFFLRALADQAAIALEHARRYGELSEMRERQSRLLETIQSTTTTFLAYLAGDLVFVEANPAWCRATGRSREELLGRRFPEVFPSDITTSILEEVRATGRASEAREIPAPGGADPAMNWDWSARPIHRPDGAVEGIVVSAIDVTEKVRARERLEMASRQKDDFLSMLAHELRNPLGAISLVMQILESYEWDDPRIVRARDAGTRQVGHMARLLDDLLDVSRITQGKINLERRPVDLREAVEQVVESTRPAIEAKELELFVSLPSEPLRIEGDMARIVQIVSNLLTNAVKYTDRRGRIELSGKRDEDSVELRVRDTGVGISSEFLPHVFDLFSQSKRNLDRSLGGMGIGLSLVKRLVEMHGGQVEAHSEGEGRGSLFVVRLPALEVSKEVGIGPESNGAAQRARRRVLVVEDNQDAAEMIAVMLELDGHEVSVAGDGLEAVDLARQWKPDVVLLDIGLPKLDGYEVARRIRGSKIRPRPLIAAMTGYGREEDRKRGEDAGIDVHLVKPARREQIVELLERE